MANVYGLIFEVEDKTGSGSRSINRNLKKIQEQAAKVKSALKGIGDVAGRAVGALGKTAAAATAAAAAFGFLAKKQLDVLDNLGKTASKLGVSTKFLSEYGFVANQAGVSTDQFQTALQRFIRRLGQAQQGSGELLKPLEALGINMRDANGNFREGTDVFEEFINKLGGVKNEAQRAALAMGAFDTEGVDLVNVASMGADEIARLRQEVVRAGGSISERLTKNAERANDALGKLVLTGKSFLNNFFGNLAPAIETLATDLNNALLEAVEGAGGMENFARQLVSDFVNGTADFLDGMALLFDGFTNSIGTITNIIQEALMELPGGKFQRADTLTKKEAELRALEERTGINRTQLGGGIVGPYGGENGLFSIDGVMDVMTRGIQNTLRSRPDDVTIGQRLFDGDEIQKMKDLSAEIVEMKAAVQRGDIVLLEKLATDSTWAQENIAGTTEKLRELSKASEEGAAMTAQSLEGMVEAAIKASEAAAAAREAALLEPAKNAFAAAEAIKKAQEQADAYGLLEQKLITLQNHQAALAQSFSNGALRMGVGYNATMSYTQAMELLGGEIAETRAEMEKLARQATYLEQPENELIDRHAELKKELDKVQLAMIRVRAEMALAAGDTSAYAFALQELTEQEKRIKEQLEGKSSTGTRTSGISEIKTLSDLQKALATDSEKAAMNMGIFKEYIASGNYSAQELEAAMNRLGISMDDLPYEQFKEVFEKTVSAGAASTENLKKLQAELNKLVADGIKLTETQQKMLDQVNEQLGTETYNVAETLENKFKNMIGTVSNTFADVLLGLKDGFTSLEDLALQSLRMIISTLIEAFIRSVILKQSLSFGGGGFFGALLGGLAALNPMTALIGGAALVAGGIAIGSRSMGGPVGSRDKSYLVGERGPEIFTPNQPGKIISNEELNSSGGGDLAVNFTINAIDTQTGVQFLLENKRVITGVIQEAYMRRGSSGPLG